VRTTDPDHELARVRPPGRGLPDIPIYLATKGRHEARGRAELALEWFDLLQAPMKMVVLETSGHRPLFEQPERFSEVMIDTVLAATASDAN
jgi:pimeloyl-ACP methyl ester carboxylesterase